MNTLRQALEEYLALRQAMGFQVRDAGSQLRRFIAFLEQQEASSITQALAVQWATKSGAVQSAESARRLTLVRGFARYRSGTDPRT
ncbi:MAG: integrase, partial [Acidihalobacter sp.]